jgi:hypothetical protein
VPIKEPGPRQRVSLLLAIGREGVIAHRIVRGGVKVMRSDSVLSHAAISSIRAYDDAPRLAAERAASLANAQEAHMREADEGVRAFTACSRIRAVGAAKLPLDADCLETVARALGAGVEIDGVYGPTAAAKDLSSFAQACCGMRTASRAGFRALEARIKEDSVHSGAYAFDPWLRSMDMGLLLERPLALTLPQLKRLARGLGVRACGTKCVIAYNVLRVLRVRHMPSARCAPYALAAVLEERKATALPTRLLHALRANVSDDRLRKFCSWCLDPVATSADRTCGVRTSPQGVLVAVRERVAERFGTIGELERATGWYGRAGSASTCSQVRVCACGATWAYTCSKGVCASCCRMSPGACARHRVPGE